MLFAEPTADIDISDDTNYYEDFGNTNNELVIYGTTKQTQQLKTITKNEITKLNPSDLSDLLEKTGSLSTNKYGSYGNASSVNIRGFSGGRILILINGIPMNSVQSGGFDLSQIPVNDIEEIQIISGGSDSKYNFSGAIGGVINIITQKKSKPGFSISGSIYNLFYYPGFYYMQNGIKRFSKPYDLFDTQKVNLSFGIGNKNVHWSISGEGNRAFNHYVYKDHQNIKRRRINNGVWDGSGRTSLTINLPYHMKIILSGSFYYGNKYIPGAITSKNIGHQYDYVASSSIFFDADLVGHEKIDTEFIISYQFKKLDWAEQTLINTHDLNTLKVINKWGFIVTNWLTINTGSDFEYSNLNSNSLGKINIFNGGGFLSSTFSIKNIAKIIPSVKLIYFDKYPIAIPKLGFVFNIGKYFTLKNNYFRLIKTPTINELYWPEDSYGKGNPDLLHEDGAGGDIILEFSRPDILNAESSFYINYMHNAILWKPSPKGIPQPNNVGEAFYFGMDHSAKSDFSKHVTLEGSYSFLLTYLLTKDFTFTSDKRMPYKPMHVFGFGIYFNWKSGNINFIGHFESERFTKTLNITELKPFFTFDINFSQTIKIVTIFASVKNAFNFLYYLIDGYPVPGGSIVMGVRLSYKGKFKNEEDDGRL